MTNPNYFDRLIDEPALQRYLETTLGSADEFDIDYHREGKSNETLFLDWGDYNLVLRRPPAGATAESAHDVHREYRILDALQETDIPVPQTVASCDDHSVIGADFYLMERCQGAVLRDEPERFATPQYRRALSERFIETIAAIHTVDTAAVGLDDLGHPDGYTERQVDRWTSQLEWAFERTETERSIPLLWDVADWLAANVPDKYDHTLVHGDYKPDNVMFGPETPPELTAVFDWELSTLGDPLTDLGLLLLFWQEPGDPDPPIPELMPTFTANPGYLSREELIERYEHESGIEAENLRFYRVLAAYKMAALGEMFFRRHLEGNAADSLYPKMREGVPRLAKRTLEMAEGSGDVSL